MQKENLSGGDKSVRGGGLRNFGMEGQALMGGPHWTALANLFLIETVSD